MSHFNFKKDTKLVCAYEPLKLILPPLVKRSKTTTFCMYNIYLYMIQLFGSSIIYDSVSESRMIHKRLGTTL